MMIAQKRCLSGENPHETIPATPLGMASALFPPGRERIAGSVPATLTGPIAPQRADEPDQAIITPSL